MFNSVCILDRPTDNVMEPYVLRWLDGVEHEYHAHHPPKKTDYVYFVAPPSIPKGQKLSKNKLIMVGPEVISGEPEHRMLADIEAQDIKQFLQYIVEYPRQLLGDILDGREGGLEKIDSTDISEISPIHNNHGKYRERRVSILDLSNRTSIHEPRLLGKPSRIIAEINLPQEPPCRGLPELFAESDLASYLIHRGTQNRRKK